MKNSDKRFLLLLILIFSLLIYGQAIKAQQTLIPTIEEVRQELEKQEIKHSDIVLRQVIQETGWLSCTNCSLDHNNLFGFWYKKKYLEFATWQESVTYMKKWQLKWYIDTNKNYYDFLTCMWKHSNGDCVPYASDKLYISNLKNIKL